MSIDFIKPFKAAQRACVRLIDRVRQDAKTMWFLRLGARYALVLAGIALYTLVIFRAAQNKAIKTYEGWFETYKIEQAAEAERVKAEALAVDPYEIQLNEEAEALARVLYGVKDNDADDLRTYCWCVFNRVENKAFPDAIEDVIAQPSQWMRYDATNPVLEPLYQIAREQLDEWHTNSHRPCSDDYVFMSWTKDDICLRNNFYEGSGCKYWRYDQ